MDLGRKMTRAEAMKLTPDQKKERNKIQIKVRGKKYKDANKEKISKREKEYREANKDKRKEYRQTPEGKKKGMLSTWKIKGLQESPENIERIYDLWQTQELCNACDIKLTRDGKCCSTQACMDHDHNTNRFRHIICRSCNNNDNWQKHFC